MDSQIAALIPVSIHAPAWGATFSTFAPIMPLSVSIHAPAWGATLEVKVREEAAKVFQSTLPHGERRFPACYRIQNFEFQSTLPHGERPFSACRMRSPRSFNPRSRMGSDDYSRELDEAFEKFQSTLPHGERPVSASPPYPSERVSIHAPAWGATGRCFQGRSGLESFNPRSRMGSDFYISEVF